MSSRTAAAAAHRSKTQMVVNPASVETRAQPAPKPPKRSVFYHHLIVMYWFVLVMESMYSRGAASLASAVIQTR